MVENYSRRIERVTALLSRECAQSKPDTTLTLSVISGSSLLAFTKLSGSAVTALTGLVRLFF
jgi:hypothetical protein